MLLKIMSRYPDFTKQRFFPVFGTEDTRQAPDAGMWKNQTEKTQISNAANAFLSFMPT